MFKKQSMTCAYKEIESKIIKLNLPIFPFFGTLLTIYRDKGKNHKCDIDFAFIKGDINFSYLVSRLKKVGFSLKSYQYLGEQENNIIEITLTYKGFSIDFFALEHNEKKNTLVHTCCNFRTRKKYKKIKKSFINKTIFKDIFVVEYPFFKLITFKFSKLKIPKNSEEIFKIHYSKDWQTPKEKEFIDYDNYKFKKSLATIIKKRKYLYSFFELKIPS